MTVKEYLELDFNDKRRMKYNRHLLEAYPWLDRRYKDTIPENYNFTWLDDMPEGWRISFGMEMVKELDAFLKENNYIDDYRIYEIKEKYGVLCWYDGGGPNGLYDIIRKYEKKSIEICSYCGNPATRRTEGYIEYLCEDCYKKIMKG